MNDKTLVETREDLLHRIHEHQCNIRLLLDVTTGLKKLSIKNTYQTTIENEIRCLSTIKNLHMSIRELQKQIIQMKQLSDMEH